MIRVGNIKEVQPKYWCHHFVFYQKDFILDIMRKMRHSLSLPSFVDICEILSSKIPLLSTFFTQIWISSVEAASNQDKSV